MNTIDFKSFIIGVLIAVLTTFAVLMNSSLINNGRYQLSTVERSFVIDTRTGSVKVCQYGVPFEDLKQKIK